MNASPLHKVRGYHAHVYFKDAVQRREALALRGSITASLPQAQLGRVHETAIFFHPQAMFQVAIAPEDLGALVEHLMLHRGSLSVMLHPLTGDPWREHTTYAFWLGAPLPLDLEQLQRTAKAS